MEKQHKIRKIIYTNDEEATTQPKNSKKKAPSQQQHHVRFKFRDYLKLVVSKIFPI